MGGVELTVRSAAELAVPLLVVATVKVVVPVTVGIEGEVDLDRVTNGDGAAGGGQGDRECVSRQGRRVPLRWRFPGRGARMVSITWTLSAALRVSSDVTVMVLALVKAAVASKKSSSLSAASAVVLVGEIVTLLTEPVSEPIV